MSKLRTKSGQFRKGHSKVPKKHHAHHRRRNPIGAATVARLAARLKGAAGMGRAARILVVRA